PTGTRTRTSAPARGSRRGRGRAPRTVHRASPRRASGPDRRLVLEADALEPELELLQHGVGEQLLHLLGRQAVDPPPLPGRRLRPVLADWPGESRHVLGARRVAERLRERREHVIGHVALQTLDLRLALGMLADPAADAVLAEAHVPALVRDRAGERVREL